MGSIRIVKSVDIDAPLDDVFSLIVDVKRRMQLGPTWGESVIDHISPEYPQEASRIRLAPAKPEETDQPAFDLLVTNYRPGVKLSYRLEDQLHTHLTWTTKPSVQGTRLTLEAEYLDLDDKDIEEDSQETQQEKLDRQAQEWVNNIKRYAELGNSLPQRLLKRVLDGFILEMPAFQRRVLLILIAFQFVTFVTFLIAATGFAIARFILQ